MRRRKRKIRIRWKRFILSMTTIILIIFFVILGIKNLGPSKGNSNKIQASEMKSSQSLYGDKNEDKSPLSDEDKRKSDINSQNQVKNQQVKEITKIEDTEEVKQDKVPENKDKNLKNVSNKEFFKDSLFIGDSITESLFFYECLDEEQVAGVKGASVYKINKNINDIIKKDYKKIFILLGSNDVESGMSCDEFIKSYRKLIESIKDKVPNCHIYVQSILPVTKKVQEKNVQMSSSRIDKFNKELKSMTKECNINFIDITSLLKGDGQKFYEPDGIHPKIQFYSVWLNYLKNNI